MIRVGVAVAFAMLVVSGQAYATMPPQRGEPMPEAYRARMQRDPRALLPKRAFTQLAVRVRQNLLSVLSGKMSRAAAAKEGGIAFQGAKRMRVLPLLFADTGTAPIPVANIRRSLFDAGTPGTLTSYYREASYGKFTVSGTVGDWKAVPSNGAHYSGGCQALCEEAPVDEMVLARLVSETSFDWGPYDNDGADGKPNTNDDDGYVDFVVFMQPQRGGECRGSSTMWSHQSSLSAKGRPDFETSTKRPDGTVIKIDGYVVSAALGCQGTTANSIGVLAHELGHAMDLPDLYDTDATNGRSLGVGVWCLMGFGGWGGDWDSPSRPMPMGAWAKTELGWVEPDLIQADRRPAHLLAAAKWPAVYKLAISPTQYYLLENRQRVGLDTFAPGAGILVWRVNDEVVEPGLLTNRVNADETNKGVEIVEADGRHNLDHAEVICQGGQLLGCGNVGDEGDPFRGSENRLSFDRTSSPSALGDIALCDVSNPAETMQARIHVAGTCAPGPQPAPAAAAAGAFPQLPPPEAGLPAVSIEALLANPSAWSHQKVRVSGTLENAGTSFFRNRRIVLTDTAKRSIPVQMAGVVAEAAPAGPSTSSAEQPATLASYLGKDVDAVAVVQPPGDGQKGVTLRLESVRPRAK